jgi:hypothetical protein
MTYQPAMAPPPKKSNTTRTVLIVVGVVLAVCCAGGVIGGFALFHVVKEATGPAQSTVDTYADALVARDYPTAYGQLCRPMRDRVAQEEFVRQQSARPALTGYEIVGLNVSNYNGRVGGSASVRFTPQGGAAETQVYQLVKEGESWRICE